MRVRCEAVSLTGTQRQQLGVRSVLASEYELSVRREYTVLGMSFVVQSPAFGSAPLFYVLDDGGGCVPVPACLFSIVDKRSSRYWQIKELPGFSLALLPTEFHREYFFDDLSNGAVNVVQTFDEVVSRMNAEFERDSDDSNTGSRADMAGN